MVEITMYLHIFNGVKSSPKNCVYFCNLPQTTRCKQAPNTYVGRRKFAQSGHPEVDQRPEIVTGETKKKKFFFLFPTETRSEIYLFVSASKKIIRRKNSQN
jgi:hypothetical protein